MKQELTAKFVMPGLVPGIHVLAAVKREKTWMAGTSPAMTKKSLLGG
jgi:hypothetical protein